MNDCRMILIPRTLTPQSLDFTDEEITKPYPRYESLEETAKWWEDIWDGQWEWAELQEVK